jgi:CxxC motif-containing protein (DUF1111 family)
MITRQTLKERLAFKRILPLFFAFAVALISACSKNPSAPANDEMATPLAGGETTIFNATSNAFSTPAPNLTGERLEKHLEGDAAFEAEFVAAPAEVNGGLGPVFNNNTCIVCHPRDGRGRPPFAGEKPASLFLRISLSGTNPNGTGGPHPVAGFGTQLFDKAIFGVQPLGEFMVSYAEASGQFADGETFSLRTPRYDIIKTYRELPAGVLISPRVAPPVFGRGLLEAIDEAAILALADENDANGDGISGKPNYVWDYQRGALALGRFGLKANNPTLLQQAAGAYNGDIGVTTPFFPIESSFGTPLDDGKNDDPELDLETLEAVTFYTQTLAVPARRNVNDPLVQRGEQLFARANCIGCHVPSLKTGVLANVPEVSTQTIHPYTDMLLHDMGEGLADGRPDFRADGREWRTPPLWGIGLTRIVNGHTFFLHDGRARNFIEAIMWHGGEAEKPRAFVQNLIKSERDALIAFLESL